MTSSAALLGLLGLAASFLPHEILTFAGSEPDRVSAIIVQVTGGLYFGFAILNWMAKDIQIGGIYSRPLAMGNFTHFAIVSIALSKSVFAGPDAWLLGAALVYLAFAVWFGLVLFTHPSAKNT